MKQVLNFLAGALVGTFLAWWLIQLPMTAEHNEKIKELQAQAGGFIQVADSLAGVNDGLIKEIEYQKQISETYRWRIERLKRELAEAENELNLLPGPEQVQVFDQNFPGPFESLILGDTVLTHLERVGEANKTKLILSFTLQENTQQGLLIASQDTIIKKLEAVNANCELSNKNLRLSLDRKEGVINEQQRVIDEAIRKRKVDAVIRWVLVGGFLVALVM
jgi:hypothetical protein